ncbi:rab-GTPase-TBC domain-containing protein [Xylogone sp. PMI_703]|nr:rab-GTPase-TBC domain-containing protein [Xylogone sp. PMI_703]
MELNGTASGLDEKVGVDSEQQSTSTLKELASKASSILDACRFKDIDALRLLATSEGGLCSDDLRREAWPLLLGCSEFTSDLESEKDINSWRDLPEHRDEGQVQLDVERSFIYYPDDQSQKELNKRKEELFDLITEVLRRQPYLCYFQGYHDICQVFLLVLDQRTRSSAVARLSVLRIRDFMLPTLSPALAQINLIPAILDAVNPMLCKHLSQTQPFFALSGTLTMYAHDIEEYSGISRLFDVLLAKGAVFSVYMFAQIVLQRSDELFETPADEPEMLHSILSKLPKPLDLEALINKTVKLYEEHPPDTLKQWKSISRYSVLRTTLSPDSTISQTLEDGRTYFFRQVEEMKWMERKKEIFMTLWKYRRPASMVGMAVLVGVLSFWLRRNTGPPGLFGALWRQWLGPRGH